MRLITSVNKRLLRISAAVSAASGMVILIGSFWPIIEYQLTSNDSSLLTPLVMERDNGTKSEIKDLTKASNWFEGDNKSIFINNSKISYYNISIPKLKIKDAVVAIGGEDLSKTLVQYPGTALPGKKGNSVIFGHSILPIFYDPKNYMSIFSTIPTLKKGDEINIKFDGISYKYLVEDKFEVLPTDIQILEQDDSDAFLSLVTCVPPGDPRKPKRLIVRARVQPINGVYTD